MRSTTVRGIVAALALGASAVQIGTGYLLCPEATISAPYRSALGSARDDNTVLTNVVSGRPARGILNRLVREVGPISADAPPFPLVTGAVQPLQAKAEAQGSGDFSPLWSGQAAPLVRALGASDLTIALATEAQSLLRQLGS
jgi:nitronate monooxygenase